MSTKLFNIWTSHAINRCKYFFYRYTLHASQIDWNIMGNGATGDLWTPSWGSARVKTLPCILAIIKFTFFVYLVRPTNKMYEKNHRKTFMYETQDGIKSLPHWFRYEFEHSQNNMLAFVPIWALNKNLYEIFSIMTC